MEDEELEAPAAEAVDDAEDPVAVAVAPLDWDALESAAAVPVAELEPVVVVTPTEAVSVPVVAVDVVVPDAAALVLGFVSWSASF